MNMKAIYRVACFLKNPCQKGYLQIYFTLSLFLSVTESHIRKFINVLRPNYSISISASIPGGGGSHVSHFAFFDNGTESSLSTAAIAEVADLLVETGGR